MEWIAMSPARLALLSLLVFLPCAAACGGGQKNAETAPATARSAENRPKTFRDVLHDIQEREAKNPGSTTSAPDDGAVDDSHEAVLRRLIAAPWGARNDKDDQIHAPLPEWEKWRRVRYWGFEHFTGFRYGKEHHALAAAFVTEMPAGTAVRSETCMRKFEAWGRPQIKAFDVKFEEFKVKWTRWRNQPLMVSYVDGALNWGLSRIEFSAAWTAYPAYPDACLIFAVAVPWRDHRGLAEELRDRWVGEGFALMDTLTPERPYRK
jgi:hypothetical protein